MITLPSPVALVWTGLYTNRGEECSVCCAENMAQQITKTKARSTTSKQQSDSNRKQLKILWILNNMQQLSRQSSSAEFHLLKKWEKLDTGDDVYYKTLLDMNWITKEEISNKKFTSLLEVLQQLSVEDIKYFKHHSAGLVHPEKCFFSLVVFWKHS